MRKIYFGEVQVMKKKLYAVMLALFLCAGSFTPVFAAGEADVPDKIAGIETGELPRLVDQADLLTDEEETELLGTLDEVSERQKVDIVVITANSLEGRTAQEAADDLYDYCGYGFGEERDGLLFLVSMEERDWWISTRGYAITAFTDAGIDFLTEQMLSDLSDGFYASAFTTYVQWCDDYITQAKTGAPYDVDNLPELPFSAPGAALIAFGIAFIIALIATGIMRLKLRSVYSRSRSDDYIKEGSFRLSKKEDLFLYKNVTRRLKPKDDPPRSTTSSGGSTTHRSSSGATHGGKGGKF